MLDRIIQIENNKKKAKQELDNLKICPNCNSEMMGEYDKSSRKITGSFVCLVCGYSIIVN